MKLNTKGFTLIELLAVIVILAILIVIATSNAVGIIANARQDVLAREGEFAVNAAKEAYPMEVLNGNITTKAACFTLNYLYKKGLYDKATGSDDYQGSVLVTPSNNGLSYTYKYWITNGSYAIEGASFGDSKATATEKATASTTCGDAADATGSGNKAKLFS